MSYGVNAPQGFVPRCYLNGSPWNGGNIQLFQIKSGYNASIFTGDPVMFDANGYIIEGVASKKDGGGATKLVGIFQGCQYIMPAGQGIAGSVVNSPYYPANVGIAPGTTIDAYVLVDPDILYDVQCSDPAGFSMGIIGQNIDGVVGAGNPITGLSTWAAKPEKDESNGQFQVVNISPVMGNVWSVGGNAPFNNVLVRLSVGKVF